MDKRSELRKTKKEYAIKLIREGFDKEKLLPRLMAEFNMSKRYTQEIIDAAQYEVTYGFQ
jgi:hypothetical protein